MTMCLTRCQKCNDKFNLFITTTAIIYATKPVTRTEILRVARDRISIKNRVVFWTDFDLQRMIM